MRKAFYSMSIMVFLMACHGQSDKKLEVLTDPRLEEKVDALVKQYMDIDIFSGVVLIAEKGQPVYHKAFGLANREKGIPNTTDTRFDIGSMNKSMTKVLILKLVSEGKLSLDDKLGVYLKGFPKEAAESITVNHLLNHQSGYGDYHTPDYWDLPMEEKSLETAAEFIRKLPLFFPPGDGQEYSNAGYVLLGLIAEKATGESYYDLIEAYITSPMNMNNTFLREKYTTPNRAIGYYKNMKGELMDNEDFGEIPTPAGGFYSITADMLKFYRAFHYGDKLWDEATRSMDGLYPFYQQHQTTGGAMTHAGGFEGSNTVHYEILRDQISVVVFANMDEVVAEDLGAGILAIIRGQEPKEPSLPAEQNVYQAFTKRGADFVKKNWEDLTVNFHPQDPKDMILNSVGYNFLFDGKVDQAIEIFRLNTELFPDIANCWDSYGEALLKMGKKEESLKAYKKALNIRPDLPSAQDAVNKLESGQD
ncbi:MAG: serine hydrolase [Ekhidna sp.]|uniref:serine hydrolase n=1 Tax=Ekhidna sp. TaxID=2608089 RepID=UPI0032EC4316